MQCLFSSNKGSYYQIKEIRHFEEKRLVAFLAFINLENQSSKKSIYCLINRRVESKVIIISCLSCIEIVLILLYLYK